MGYYEECAFPKPKSVKKKKKVNGFKDKAKRKCIYCGQAAADRHEVFRGPYRQNSIDHGFQIDLCREHHREIQDDITPWAKGENLRWRKHFQRKYEDELIGMGIDEKDARKLAVGLIGKNYLDDGLIW